MSPLTLKLHPQTLTLASFGSLRPFSSSSSPSPPPFPPVSDHQSNNNDNNNQQQQTPSPSSYSSLFGDIKNRLKSAQPPPRRIPDNPSPPPPPPAASIADIRKTLAEFRLRSPPNPPDPNNPTPSSVPSFQQLFKINNDTNAPAAPNRSNNSADRLSFQSIRASLQQFRDRPNNQPPGFRNRVSHTPAAAAVVSAPLVGDQESVFGKEGEAETKKLRTEFLKSYSFDELGEKLRRLRPDGAEKAGGFSPEELNGRLAKLRELEEKEEKENELRMGGVGFRDLRESLLKLKEADDNKKANNTQKLSMLVNIGKPSLPLYMMAPPQEKLLENYFHPDHMSSAEKMKLELKKVRDEFKMSESDCGSARVQVAQLTTKIKHLSSVLHKKDKHSRKGLHEMVQTRKKLLKYLRRTDWESYCFVLSKLGLRDVPEYKTPDYKA